MPSIFNKPLVLRMPPHTPIYTSSELGQLVAAAATWKNPPTKSSKSKAAERSDI